MVEQWEICQIVNYRFSSARFSHEETTMTIREEDGEWKPSAWKRKATRKGKFVGSFPPPDRGNEGDGERCTKPRGVVLQPARFAYLCRASFACHLHHHLTSACSFCMPRPTASSFSSLLLEMHRCIRSLHNYYDYRE